MLQQQQQRIVLRTNSKEMRRSRCRCRCRCRCFCHIGRPFLLLLLLSILAAVSIRGRRRSPDSSPDRARFVSSFPSATNLPSRRGLATRSSSSAIAGRKRTGEHPGNSESRFWFLGRTGVRRFSCASEDASPSPSPSPSRSPSMAPKAPAPTDWVIVEEYPRISPEGIDPYRILDSLRNPERSPERSNDKGTETSDNTSDGNTSDNNNDTNNRNDRAEKYLGALERLAVTATNATLPVALMGLDPDRFGSLSNARKACRQGRIALRCDSTGSFRRGKVADRVHPGDAIARRELYGTILAEAGAARRGASATAIAASAGYDTLGRGFVKSKFQRLPVAYEDDCMAIVVKPPGLLVHPQGKNGSWGRKNNVVNALPYFLRKPGRRDSSHGSRDDDDDHSNSNNNNNDNTDEEDDDDDTVLEKPVPVHRLDFATSGLLVAAKTKGAARLLAQEFEYRTARKTYTAMVYGIPRDNRDAAAPSEIPSFFGPGEADETAPNGMGVAIAGEANRHHHGEDRATTSFADNDDANEWRVADCFLDGKRATTLWRILGSHNCSVPIRYDSSENEIDDGADALVAARGAATATATVPVSLVELKPEMGRYHQLRRTLAWLYRTPIVGDPIYAEGFVEDTYLPPAARLVEGKRARDYNSCLMLCSNEIDVAHPVFNTPDGKREWEQQQQQQQQQRERGDENRSEQTTDPSSDGESFLYQDGDGVVRVRASIPLPKKFTKFLDMMERQKRKKIASEEASEKRVQ